MVTGSLIVALHSLAEKEREAQDRQMQLDLRVADNEAKIRRVLAVVDEFDRRAAAG